MKARPGDIVKCYSLSYCLTEGSLYEIQDVAYEGDEYELLYQVYDDDGDLSWFNKSHFEEEEVSITPNSEVTQRGNEGKIDFTLIPVCAEEEEAKVWMFGEKEYSRDNWKLGGPKSDMSSLLASLIRHTKELQKGNILDKKSGIHHAAHIRANAAMIIYHHPGGESDE